MRASCCRYDGMEMIRVLLVDDEAPARMRLRALVEATTDPPVRIVGEAESAAEAERVLATQGVDLVLLDIAMPGVDGLQLAQRWRALADAPAVVFVTAHAEHALRAFELAAADYLTKPVRRERLQAALQRVAQRRSTMGAAVLVVSDRGRMLRVPLADVLYLKAELKYVTLRTAAGTYVLDDALADLEPRLGERFVRVHRNAIVACNAVRALERRTLADGEGWAVRVAPVDEWLAVSRRQQVVVRNALEA